MQTNKWLDSSSVYSQQHNKFYLWVLYPIVVLFFLLGLFLVFARKEVVIRIPAKITAETISKLQVPIETKITENYLYENKVVKKGEKVELEDGRIIDGKDFVGPSQKGRIVTILGDTRKHPNAEILAKDADLLVHESTFNKNEKKLAKAYFHSTTEEAAEVARDSGVEKLVLTHISARYVGNSARELENEAKDIFPNSQIVRDFDCIDITFKGNE